MANKTNEMMAGTDKRNAKPVIDHATNCRHEWIDDGMFTLVCVHCEAEEVLEQIEDAGDDQ